MYFKNKKKHVFLIPIPFIWLGDLNSDSENHLFFILNIRFYAAIWTVLPWGGLTTKPRPLATPLCICISNYFMWRG
jgi:hypothetical protein